MKPIFIILYPTSEIEPINSGMMTEVFQDIKKQLSKDYHILLFCSEKDAWDFKLLNGTQEEYDKLSEITEQILMKEII